MATLKATQCPSCGATLDVDINRAYIFCSFCGCKILNEQEQMGININIGNANITAHTNIESLLTTAEHYISIKDLNKATETITAAILSGVSDYRVYIIKAKIDLLTDNNAALFDDLTHLRSMEQNSANAREVTAAIMEFMHFRGMNGVIALHIATFHELMDWTQYCVDHGSDVNCVAGMNRVTPISIMFVPVSSASSRLDGTPFIRNKAAVKSIRRYLMSVGAIDSFRFGY